MPSRHARSVTAAVALTLLAGCSGSGQPETAGAGASTTRPTTTVAAVATTAEATVPPSSAATSTTVPSGMKEVTGDGFEIALPESWSGYLLAPDGTVQALDDAQPLPVGLEGLAMAAGLQGAGLFAVAPPNPDGRSDTMLVTATGGDDEPATADVSDALRQRLAADGVSDLRMETIEVGGRTAARATFRHVDELAQEQEAVTVYVPDRGTSFVLAFARPLPPAADSAVTFDRIVDTFRTA
jgi:hypothetical protein